ncbi:MAG: phosphopantothenoylcysteine decarboxylase [Bdellovibrionota bacterium]
MIDDLQIDAISDSLKNWTLDVIVSGSIGAVESVRFIRSLRRLGACIQPWLTSGGSQFTTPLALNWAANGITRREFRGESSHLALNDACVVAPASANFIASVAHGITSTPATALVASYLGAGKPVFILPNMHMSLYASPAVQKNIEQLREYVEFVSARKEEGKLKFPEPAVLADHVSHSLNSAKAKDAAASCLLTMGSTLGYIDDVRYVSNYSSGKLGSLIVEELYRHGVDINVVAGQCQYYPRSFNKMVEVKTNNEMLEAVEAVCQHGISSAIMAASVLDYIPDNKTVGKISSDSSALDIHMVPTDKIISHISCRGKAMVGFKLEYSLTDERIQQISETYIKKYDLSMLVLNCLGEVSPQKHKAIVVTGNDVETRRSEIIEGKQALAGYITKHVLSFHR